MEKLCVLPASGLHLFAYRLICHTYIEYSFRSDHFEVFFRIFEHTSILFIKAKLGQLMFNA